MFKYFFLATLVLSSLIGGSGFLIVNLLETSLLIENKSIAQSAVNTIKQQTISVGGRIYLPYGENKTNYHGLPSSFYGSKATAKGLPLVYCPYAQDEVSAPTDTVTVSDSGFYNVSTETALSPSSQPYVVASEKPIVEGIAAFIIIPTKSGVLPQCDDVILDDESNMFELSGDSDGLGSVEVVTFDQLAFFHQNGISEFLTAGENLEEKLSEVAVRATEDAVITLESGQTFNIGPGFDLSSLSQRDSRSIILKSSGSSPAVVDGDVGSQLSFRDVDFEIKNITFSSNVKIKQIRGKSTFTSSVINQFSAKDAEVLSLSNQWGVPASNLTPIIMDNTHFVQRSLDSISSSSNVLVAMENSKWTGDHGITLNYSNNPIVFQMYNSEFSLQDASISSTGVGQALFFIDQSSELNLSNISWSNDGSLDFGFFNKGNMNLKNSSLSSIPGVNMAIQTKPGSKVHSESTTIGSSSQRVAIGWEDEDASSLSGDVTIYAATCNQGGRFESDDYSVTMKDRFGVRVSLSTGIIIQHLEADRTVPVDVNQFLAPLTINCL